MGISQLLDDGCSAELLILELLLFDVECSIYVLWLAHFTSVVVCLELGKCWVTWVDARDISVLS